MYVEESLISILQILERALALERPLLNAASEVNRSMLILGLSKLILGNYYINFTYKPCKRSSVACAYVSLLWIFVLENTLIRV